MDSYTFFIHPSESRGLWLTFQKKSLIDYIVTVFTGL